MIHKLSIFPNTRKDWISDYDSEIKKYHFSALKNWQKSYSKNRSSNAAEQGDQLQGWVLYSNVGAIMWKFALLSCMYCPHFLSSSWGMLKLNAKPLLRMMPADARAHMCPISWAIVNAAESPLSSIMAQLFCLSHIVPNSAKPRVSHLSRALKFNQG